MVRLISALVLLLPLRASAYSDTRPWGPVSGNNNGGKNWKIMSATSTTDSAGNPIDVPFVAVAGSITAVTNLPATGATVIQASGSGPWIVQEFGKSSTVMQGSNPWTVNYGAAGPATSATVLQGTNPWTVAYGAAGPATSATVLQGTNPWVTSQGSASWYADSSPADLTVTSTGAANAAITISIPNVSGKFHYITMIEIVKYVTAAIAASATPINITTTNLRNTVITMRNVGSIADIETALYQFTNPLKSTTVNTATTIVMPAVTGVVWYATVHYYVAN